MTRFSSFQFSVRKPSRELTYIEEEDEEKLPEIKVTRNRKIQLSGGEGDDGKKQTQPTDNSDVNPGTKAHNVTIVNLEHKDVIEKEAAEEVSEEVIATKDNHDRHVRFTSKVEEIDYKEADDNNEKTS